MSRFIVALMLGIALSVAVASATPTIDVGSHELLPNMPLQQFVIPVAGGDAVQGLNLLIQIGDGGPPLGGSANSAPKITDIAITTGTIFDGNNTGRVFDDPPTDQFWQIHTTTSSGTVATSGTLAVVTMDTTGFYGGTFPVLLGNIGGNQYSNTDFAGVPAMIVNGAISVPEPTILLFPVLSVAFASRRRR